MPDYCNCHTPEEHLRRVAAENLYSFEVPAPEVSEAKEPTDYDG